MAVTRNLALAAMLGYWVLLAGCAGNGVGLDQSGRPLPPGGGSGGTLTASFASIQEHVFTPICSVCHAGGGAPQGLRLDAGNSYAMLVGVPSTEVPTILRVKATDPDNSYIIQKLEGHAAVGARMPFGGPYLDADTIAAIRQWILEGAAPPPAVAAAAFELRSVAPATGDVAAPGLSKLIIAFSKALDPTRLDANSIRLERILATGQAQNLAVALHVPDGNPMALLIQTDGELAPGAYRLSIPASPATGLSSLDSERVPGTQAGGADVVVTEFEVAGDP